VAPTWLGAASGERSPRRCDQVFPASIDRKNTFPPPPLQVPLSAAAPDRDGAAPLRDYQIRAVADLRRSFLSCTSRVLFVLSTGGGKTVILANIIDSAARRGKRVLVVVHIDEGRLRLVARLNGYKPGWVYYQMHGQPHALAGGVDG
jgi:type I site-specific restriction endonuclease